MADVGDIAPHSATETHRYIMHYPEHPAREGDPHYVDFHHFHAKYGPDARCAFAVHATLDGDPPPVRQSDFPRRLIGAGEERALCDTEHPIELHHAHVEFSLQNGVDLALLEKDYPGISDRNNVGAWVESAANFVWYCAGHHRGAGGAHSATASDFEAEHYISGLITPIVTRP